MPNYSIGLSGLNASSSAMDVISNNIANASTVGYRAGDFIFEDQFFKAINPQDPARAGQGVSRQNIRRLFNVGTVQSSANPLDMAITGASGLFRLETATDPSEIYYSRNGQFAVSKDVDLNNPKRSYIVNENGMHLNGYISLDGTEEGLSDSWTNKLSMPPTELEPITTTASTVAVTLDARQSAFLPNSNTQFDPNNPSTYNNKISQTVYSRDDNGNPHTLTLYYRRVEDENMTVEWDGEFFRYPPSTIANQNASLKETGGINDNAQAYVVLSKETSAKVAYLTAANRDTKVSATVTNSSSVTVQVANDIAKYARVVVNNLDTQVLVDSVSGQGVTVFPTVTPALTGISAEAGDEIKFFNPKETAEAGTVAVDTVDGITTTTVTLPSNGFDIQKDQYVWIDRGGDIIKLNVTVTAKEGTTVTFKTPEGSAPDIQEGDVMIFYNPVTYTLPLQDGSKVSMVSDVLQPDAGPGTAQQKFTAVTSQYEVYASLDDKFFNHVDPNFHSDTPITPTITPSPYAPIASMNFWGGKNIDGIRYDPVTGRPAFESKVKLTSVVTTPGTVSDNNVRPLIFDLDLTATRNYATPFAVDQSFQNGKSVSLLSNVSVDNEGKIIGVYGDGRQFIAGQLVLVNFAATNGLVPSGGNVFQASALSGDEVHPNVIVGKPGQKGLSSIKAASVESSNVDLAGELVKLLIQQRMYSANSQSIRAFDDSLTTTIRMTGG